MPQYKKVFDIGTYTGNGGQYRVGIPTLRSVGPTGTQIAGATRFRNSDGTNNAYLSKTFGSAGNRKTWTFSCWLKIGNLYSPSGGGHIFDYNSGSGYNRTYHQLVNYNLEIGDYTTGWSWQVTTTQVFKDTAKWYHYVLAFDTTQATAANRVVMYIDGQRITNYKNASYPSQNYDAYINQAAAHSICGIGYNGASGFDGYMSQMYFVDGTALTASSFGEYNSDGIWVPKAASGLTYGTNGFYLPMNSSSNYATDQSGNGNNWTPNNMNVVTANTTYDIMTDSPTDYLSGSMSTANNAGNYCVMNPVDSSTAPNSGNLNVSHPQNDYGTFSSYFLKSGRYWAECTVVTGPYLDIGICKSQYIATSGYANAYLYQGNNGYKAVLGTATAYGSTYTTGDVIGIDLDIDGGTVTFYKQTSGSGSFVSQGSISIASNSDGYKFYSLNAASNQGTMAVAWNFGQRAFNNTSIPSGAKAVNTYNIPRPADSSLWFYGDTPDLMWIKNRSTTGLHTITDTVRGVGLNLVTSSTAAETSYPGVTEMNKFGMSIINDATSILNGSTNSHVYWAWKAGSNTSSTSVTNTDGSITSQVSANRQAGFSIVTWTHNGSSGTIGHGLGATPVFIITKTRSAVNDWFVYHQNIGATGGVYLNLTNATGTTSAMWNNTGPTSSVFTAGATFSTYTCVAYCFTAIPGYSAFGSYTGNGSADGPFVYLGFRPRWLLVKRTDAANDWLMWDSTRDTYNLMQNIIYANATTAETTYVNDKIDFLSNGFKQRQVGTAMNGSGATYIYAAFAEIPFNFSRAR